MKLRIGLTGGIGSGKSLVGKFFSELGVPVIDADLISHQITRPGHIAFEKIIVFFGSSILNSDGSLNRAALKKLIFEDSTKRAWLEKLLHPLIRAEMAKQIENSNYPYCIVMIPLLAEAKQHPMVDRVLVIDTEPETQLQRVLERDRISLEQANKIIKAQASRETRLALADDIVCNEASPEDLRQAVATLHKKYLNLARTS